MNFWVFGMLSKNVPILDIVFLLQKQHTYIIRILFPIDTTVFIRMDGVWSILIENIFYIYIFTSFIPFFCTSNAVVSLILDPLQGISLQLLLLTGLFSSSHSRALAFIGIPSGAMHLTSLFCVPRPQLREH